MTKAITNKGYNGSENILDRKIRYITTYRGILDNNIKKSTGRGRTNWEYYQTFQEIFPEDKTINSTNVVDTKISSQILTNVDSSTGNGNTSTDTG